MPYHGEPDPMNVAMAGRSLAYTGAFTQGCDRFEEKDDFCCRH